MNRHTETISIELNFTTGRWELSFQNIDAGAIDSYDGVTVTLTIGDMVGTDTVNMYINSLSFNGN